MRDNKYIVLLRTMLITGIAFVVNYGISLVLTPYITKNVGTDAFGFVTLAKSCAQYAMIITAALNSFASRYIAVEYHQKNYEKANVYFSSVYWGNIGIGSAILFVAFMLIIILEKLLVIPENLQWDVKLLFVFVFVNFWITTVYSVYTSAAYIKNKLDISGIFKALSYIVEALILMVFYALFPKRLFYVGIGLIGLSIVVSSSNVWINNKYTPELRPKFSCYSFDAVKRLIIDGIWASLNSLGNILNSGLDLIVCNLMLSPLAMGQIAITKTVETIFAGLYQLVAQAFQPMFLKSYANGNYNQLIKELKLSMRVGGLFANLAFAVFFAFGVEYFTLWVPNEDIDLLYQLTLITVVAGVATGPMTPLYYIYTLTVKKAIPCIVTIIGGLMNVIGMYVLIRNTDLGVYAVVLTTTIIMSIINLITNPLYMAHVLNQKKTIFYPEILRNIISCAVITLALYLIHNVYKPSSWLQFAFAIVLSAIVGTIIHCIVSLHHDEWIKLRKKLKVGK